MPCAKKRSISSGASSLRSSAAPASIPAAAVVSADSLNAAAQALNEWVDPATPSKIRMMLLFQGSGGLPYVASVHHVITQSFLVCGNSGHVNAATPSRVCMAEFQDAIRERHRIGDSGITASTEETAVNDFS